MHKFVRNLITEWRKLDLPFSGESIVVATSGGADSTALVLALADLTERKKLDLKIVVAHFNHKLRGKESDEDERFVRALAKSCGFAFAKANGEFKGKANLEERARDARYAFLSETARKRKARVIVTAHTQNDQAETFLLNLIRGSGREGLGGMKAVRVLASGGVEEKRTLILARPLLGWAKRPDTEEFCRHMAVEYRSDSMNDDRTFSRVRVRKDVIPLLAELNPKIVETLTRTAELIQDEASIPEKQAESGDILISAVKMLEKPQLYRVLRSWLAEKRGNTRGLTLKHIEGVGRLVLSPKSGRIIELPGGASVVKSGGRLAFHKRKLEN